MSPFLIYTIVNIFFKEPFYSFSKDETSEMDEFLYPLQIKQRNIKEHNFFLLNCSKILFGQYKMVVNHELYP